MSRNIKIDLQVPDSFLQKAKYIFDSFFLYLDITPSYIQSSSDSAPDILYSSSDASDCSPVIHIYHDPTASDFFTKAEIYPFENIDYSTYNDMSLPFLFSPKGEVIKKSSHTIYITKDIIASAFYLMSCWQEYIAETQDKAQPPPQRYDYDKSITAQETLKERPIVDYYFMMLRDVLQIKKKHAFTMSLTHDIDYFDVWSSEHYKKTMRYNLSTIFSRPLKSLYKIIAHSLTKYFWHPEHNLKKILTKEKSLGCHSTTFLLTASDVDDRRLHYFKDYQSVEMLKRIYAGQSVGLHGSGRASIDLDTMSDQLDILRQHGFTVDGYRSHYLLFSYQHTFDILEKLNFTFDSTLGFAENIGFRAGISQPFYPYNITKDRPFKVLEIPLSIMDTSLFAKKYMGLSLPNAKKRVFDMIDHIITTSGHITLLWHNNSFDWVDYPGYAKLYWDIIRYAQKKGATFL
jgi:hypothetical protein